jgi:hypothetical protein
MIGDIQGQRDQMFAKRASESTANKIVIGSIAMSPSQPHGMSSCRRRRTMLTSGAVRWDNNAAHARAIHAGLQALPGLASWRKPIDDRLDLTSLWR